MKTRISGVVAVNYPGKTRPDPSRTNLADKPVNYSMIGLTQPIAYATFSLRSWRRFHEIL